MLRKLSLRNAGRQFREYALYFITLACTAAFMYAFNALIDSDSVSALSGMEILPLMIVTASLLIVLVMGWVIGYMTNYMLKKRSREFSIYMVSGISNKAVGSLIFHENILIGSLAFLLGLPVGVFLSQLLEAVLLPMFGITYELRFRFSPSAAGLTLLYFFVMLVYSLRKNRKWIRRVKLYDLLLLDRQNETILLSGGAPSAVIFLLSVLAGGAGIGLLYAQPFGSGYDALAGILLLVLFVFGFFISVPAFLVSQFGSRSSWKYSKNRLVTFRDFTAKIHSLSITLGMLSALFLLSFTLMGIGTAVGIIANKNVELSVFDIMILHKGELQDFSDYEDGIQSDVPILESHTYGIYTDKNGAFLDIRDSIMADMGHSGHSYYAEFRYDTFIKQSDYNRLRKMLGYEVLELNPSLCYVHCVPAMGEKIRVRLGQGEEQEYAGYSFAGDCVFTEPFSQTDAYGNGYGYVIVVPDQAADRMEVLYSLYAAVTEKPLNSADLTGITENFEGLDRLRRNVGISVPGTDAATALIGHADFLTGKWSDKEALFQLYAMAVCLFYLSFVLEITGAAILATQVLGDREKKRKQNRILRQMGMEERMIARLNNRQLSLIFMFPLLPALIAGGSFVCVGASKMYRSAFGFPVFFNSLWIIKALGIAFVFFILLFTVYYIAARISFEAVTVHGPAKPQSRVQ